MLSQQMERLTLNWHPSFGNWASNKDIVNYSQSFVVCTEVFLHLNLLWLFALFFFYKVSCRGSARNYSLLYHARKKDLDLSPPCCFLFLLLCEAYFFPCKQFFILCVCVSVRAVPALCGWRMCAADGGSSLPRSRLWGRTSSWGWSQKGAVWAKRRSWMWGEYILSLNSSTSQVYFFMKV